MEYNTATLSNGLRIIHLPSSSPVVYCGFGINAGTRNELDGEEGVAHFCEHTTFKGTERRRFWRAERRRGQPSVSFRCLRRRSAGIR